MEKKLLLGDEAIALGAIHAGLSATMDRQSGLFGVISKSIL